MIVHDMRSPLQSILGNTELLEMRRGDTLVGRILAQVGHEIWQAGDGFAGLKICRAQPLDLVIAAIVMPDKEGLDTIREARRNFPDMKIIAMSGGGVGSAETCLRIARHLGARRTIEKPVTLSKLVAVVNDVLALPPKPPA